jgi:hypothetical protein
MALTAALKAAHAAVDDAVASHAAAETLVNNLRNTIAQLPLAICSSDAQPANTADRAALDTNLDLAQRAASATKSQLDGARGLLIDASTYSAPRVPDSTSAPSSTASTAAATVPVDSVALAFELARAEANTLAKQSTETWPQVNVPTVLEYDMNNYGQWRRWFHNQAAVHKCVTAPTYEPPAAPPLGRKFGCNQVRNLMQILVASVDATLLQLTGDSDSVVITLDNLRRRAPSPGATVDARTFTADLSNIAAYLQDHATVDGAILSAAPEHLAATPAEQLKRILSGLQDIPSLSFLQEKQCDDASVTLQDVAEVERIIRRRFAIGSAALSAVEIPPKRNNDKAPRDNRKIRKIGEGGTCTRHGRFVAHKPSECRYKPNAPAVVAATATTLSLDEIRAACAADTSAAIQEAFKALLNAQATSGKDAIPDYSLWPRIIFDSGATTTMLLATTPLEKRTPTSVRISLPIGTPEYATHHGVLTIPMQSGAPLQLKALEVPSFPAGLFAVRDIASQHPALFQERRVYCLRRQPLLRAADVLVFQHTAQWRV